MRAPLYTDPRRLEWQDVAEPKLAGGGEAIVVPTVPSRSVCVIGAQGALGRAVVAQCLSAGLQVHRAGRRPDAREGYRQLDLDRPETIAPAVSDVDLIISTVPHPGLTAERFVLERGGVLVNCSHAPARAVAALAAQVSDPQGAVLLNAGLVPGVANLLAAELLEEHEQAGCLEVAFTVLGGATAGKAGGEFAHRGLTARRHHRVIKRPLPEPFGELACIEFAEGEDGGFGGVAGSRRIERYLGFGDRPLSLSLRAINALHLMQTLPKAAFVVERGRRSEASSEPTAIWVAARRGSQRLGASVMQCDGDYRTTAAAARIFGERLIERKRAGCFNPEDLFSLRDLLAPLQEVGVRIAS